MKLKHNIQVMEPEGRKVNELSVAQEPLSAGAPLGVVFVFNCTPVAISGISVNGVALTALPNSSDPGQSPQCVSVNRFGPATPIFSASTLFVLTFVDGTTYSQTVSVNAPSMANVTLWCFYTGLVLSDQYGAIRQLSWGI